MRTFVIVALLLATGGAANAGPFPGTGTAGEPGGNGDGTPGRGQSGQSTDRAWSYGSPENSPTSVTPPAELPEEVQAVQEQSLPPVVTVPGTSPQQGIAGDKRPDAGSPSLIGRLIGDKMKIELGDELAKVIKDFDLSKLPQPKVSISAPISPETSASLESLPPRLHTLLTFLQVAAGLFVGGKLGQWGVLAVSGLRSFISGVSSLQAQLSAAQQTASGAPTASPAVTQAAPSTTPKPGT